MSDFSAFWQTHHPSGPPVAHILRRTEHESWVRFHSLPLSKRYATTRQERRIVLERANTLASRVLGEGVPCWLVQADPDYSDADDHDADPHDSIKEWGLDVAFEYRDVEDACTYRIHARLVTWSAGAFNDLIARRADCVLPVPTMWVSTRNGAAFAPYDGGSDLFLPSAADAADLKRDFPDWLPAHPDGL